LEEIVENTLPNKRLEFVMIRQIYGFYIMVEMPKEITFALTLQLKYWLIILPNHLIITINTLR